MDLGLTDRTMTQSRWWFATWNNPPEGDDPPALGMRHTLKICFVTGQRELSRTGTEHFQFLVYLKRDQRLSYMKAIHPTIHWEPVKNLARCYEYVHKEESRMSTFPDFGAVPKSLTTGYNGHGGREKSEPLKVINLITKSFEELAQDMSAGAYNSAVRARQHYMNQVNQKNVRPTKNIPCRGQVYYGESGVGKSTGVRLKYWEKGFFVKHPNQWWNGYNRQRIIILDDLQPSHTISKSGEIVILLTPNRKLTMFRFWA
jgi:hypothetical protein